MHVSFFLFKKNFSDAFESMIKTKRTQQNVWRRLMSKKKYVVVRLDSVSICSYMQIVRKLGFHQFGHITIAHKTYQNIVEIGQLEVAYVDWVITFDSKISYNYESNHRILLHNFQGFLRIICVFTYLKSFFAPNRLLYI